MSQRLRKDFFDSVDFGVYFFFACSKIKETAAELQLFKLPSS